MDKKHKGAFAELKAASWLLSEGYEVFRNVSQHGSVDIIALKPETKETLLIDVKTAPAKTQVEPKGNIRILGFFPDTGNCQLF